MPGQLEQRLTVGMAARPTAEMVAFAGVLELTSAQLAERVARACEENPALERDEVPLCRCCGERLHGTRCWSCDWSRDAGSHGARAPVAEPVSAGGAADLLADLRVRLPARDASIAEYLVFNLGARGLLEVDVAEVVAALGVAPDRVRHVLRTLREVGPPGIAARSARECLLLQLDCWEQDHGASRPLVRVVVDRHLGDLAAGRIGRVAEATGQPAEAVRHALAFVRAHLRPFPAIDLSSRGGSVRLLPDVAFRRESAARYGVELLERHRIRLRVRELGPGGPVLGTGRPTAGLADRAALANPAAGMRVPGDRAARVPRPRARTARPADPGGGGPCRGSARAGGSPCTSGRPGATWTTDPSSRGRRRTNPCRCRTNPRRRGTNP